jgi:DNA-binding HxlR family transcriptional regulator
MDCETHVKRSRSTNKECSIARAMDVVGDRWSILLLREAFYGTRRFDEFQYYLGVAPNILSARLKKFVDLGMMLRVPLPEHGGRHEYVLTEKGRDFFPTYLALKKWGDDWLAEAEGPQVVFRDRSSGRQIESPAPLSARGKPLQLEDIEIVPGAGAVRFNRKRFAGQLPHAKIEPKSASRVLRKSAGDKKK